MDSGRGAMPSGLGLCFLKLALFVLSWLKFEETEEGKATTKRGLPQEQILMLPPGTVS